MPGDKQRDQVVLTRKQAQKIKRPIVYGLCDADGLVFYVGRTINPKGRFCDHSRGSTSNQKLHDRLISAPWFVRVLKDDPKDICDAERQEIRKRKGLLNLIGADHPSWEWHSFVPWAMGPGRFAPSSIMKKKLEMPEAKKGYSKALKRMTVPQRCLYELELADILPEREFGEHVRKWKACVMPKFQRVIEEYGSA